MEKYLETFSGVRDYMERIKRQAKADGYVSTLMGRRRWLPELKSSNFNLRAFGERVALNMPIQGTAADVMKLAMIRVAARLKAEGLQAQLILQVHDELIVECPQAEETQVKEILTQEMEGQAASPSPHRRCQRRAQLGGSQGLSTVFSLQNGASYPKHTVGKGDTAHASPPCTRYVFT